MAELLSEVEYGRILGSFTAVAEDFGDTVAPDAIPLTGTVTFYPSQSHVSYINLAGETASLYIPPTSASIVNGRIIGSDGKDGVVLLASNSNNVSASVLWTARISINPINSGDPAPADHDFLIEVRRGEIASLIDVIKATSRVHNIALFHDAIAEAAAAFWERVESGEFRGNQGPPGPAGVGVGVPGPSGVPGIMGKDGDPGVGGNLIPDGDLEVPGFLVSGDYQESSDAVSGKKAVRFSNATSRRIRLEPDTSYVGTVYLKSAEATAVTISQRVFGSEGDIDRVIEDSYQIPANTWQRVTFLLDSNVGDQSMEIVVTTDGRTISADLFALSDNSVVKGLQRDLTAAKAQLEAAMAQLDLDLAEVDADKEMLAVSLNDLAVVLEDADVDLTELNAEMEDLKNDLAAEETKRQDADAAAQVILEQLDTNLAEAKQELVDNKIILETLDTDLATAKEELLASAQSITKLETETLPELQRVLEEANTAAIQELAALDDKLYGAAGDITAAKASIAQLAADLTTEAQTRAQLALDLQDDFEERDTRLAEAESILSAAFPDGAVNVPEELSRTIRDSVVQYAVANSSETPPTTGWSAAAPTKDPGQYIWFRTLITYGDNSTSTSSAALLTGNTGPGGPQGPAGADGTDGTGVTILGSKASEAQLPTTGNDGDAYLVGGYLYVWSSGSWSNVGLIRGPQGVPGPAGEDGEPRYTWVKYASSATGTGISDDPAGKSYIGLAYNKTTAVESDTPGDYQWALIQGPQGSPGIQGPAGEDGTSLYTWLKYASTPTTGMSDSPIGKDYIGLAYNKTTPTESDTYTDYQWTLIKGAKGDQGVPGDPGADGTPRYTWVKYATSGAGAGMSDDPTGKTYIGLAYNKTTATESTVASDYQWALIQGPRGEAGPQGVPGPEGADGQSLYTWIKYATTPTTGMADLPAGKKYMGIAYNKPTATESSSYSDYEWSLIEGPQGNQGIQGPAGADGQPTYTWIKYASTDAGGSMSDTPTGKSYIGLAYNKPTATESTVASDYQWALIQGPAGDRGPQGIPGPTGLDGPSLFTWIKYADSPTTGMSELPAGKKYMGISYNNTTASESSTYGDYEWSLIEGPQGNQGIQGPKGADGQTTYTWIKYGTSSTGAGMSDSPTGKTYIGIAYNKPTATESGSASDYQWSLIQGPQGATGGTGPQGIGISSITPYYRDVVRGAAAPAVPTTATPSGWATSEPTWVPNRDLYRVEKITYTNSTFAYTAVTKIAAYAGIDAAMAAANGKNLNTYTDLASASKPGPAPAPNSARTSGDVHRNRDSSTGEIWAEYQWTGSAWKEVSYGDEILRSLDVGKVTGGTGAFQQFFADKLIADSATINKLWTDQLVGKTAAFNQISVAAGNILVDPNGLDPTLRARVGGASWSWDDVGKYWKAPSINGGTTQYNAFVSIDSVYDSNLIDPGAMYVIKYDIWVDKVASNTVGRAAIYYRKKDGSTSFVGDGTEDGGDTDAGDTITAGAWTTVERFWRAPNDAQSGGICFQILYGATGSTEVRIRNPFVGKQAPAVLIEDGAISAQKVNAESVGAAVGKFIKLETSQLVATDSITTPSAVIDKLWADGISAKSITTSKLTVAPNNLFPDPYFQDPGAWVGGGVSINPDPNMPNGSRMTLTSSTVQRGAYYNSSNYRGMLLEPGASYRLRALVRFGGNSPLEENITFYVRIDDNVGGARMVGARIDRKAVAEYTWHETTFVVPADVRGSATVGFFTTGPYDKNGITYIGGVELTRMSGTVHIENGAVNADKIVASSVGAAVGEFVKLDVKNLTASSANINSLVAQRIAAGTAAFQTVNADKIIASTATMDSAVINQIWADGIAAKTITTNKLTVATGNLVPDGDEMITDEQWTSSSIRSIVDKPDQVIASRTFPAGMGGGGIGNEAFPVTPGQEYSVQMWIKASKPNSRFYMEVRAANGTGTHAGTGQLLEPSVASTGSYILFSGGIVPTVWTLFRGTWTANSDVSLARLGTFYFNHSNGTERAADISIAGLSIKPKVGAVLIENGAISANHITADSIDTDHLRTNAVSAAKIVAGAITTAKMTANSINGDRISANSLQANKIVANTITATQIKARAISAEEIATRTLLAENIVANTLTANEIKSRTITAAEIRAGTITANEVNVDHLWANGISAKAISTARLTVSSGNAYWNPDFADSAGHGSYWVSGGGMNGGNSVVIPAGTGQKGSYDLAATRYSERTVVSPGETYVVGAWVRLSANSPASANNVTIYARTHTESSNNSTYTSILSVKPSFAFTSNTWYLVEGSMTIPDDCTRISLGFYTESGFTGSARFSNPVVKLAMSGQLIADQISGEYVYGTVVEGGEIRTSNSSSRGRYIIGDNAYVHPTDGLTTPGMQFIGNDPSKMTYPAGIGTIYGDIRFSGGKRTDGALATMDIGAGSIYMDTQPGSSNFDQYTSSFTANERGTNMLVRAPGTPGAVDEYWIAATAPIVAYATGQELAPGSIILRAKQGAAQADAILSKTGVRLQMQKSNNLVSSVVATNEQAYIHTEAGGSDRYLTIDQYGTWVKTYKNGAWHNYNLEETANDSGWKSIATASGIVNAGSPAYRIKNNVIYFRGTLTKTSNWVSGWNLINSGLPTECRPDQVQLKAGATSSGATMLLQMTPAGRFEFWLDKAMAGSTTVQLSPLFFPLG